MRIAELILNELEQGYENYSCYALMKVVLNNEYEIPYLEELAARAQEYNLYSDIKNFWYLKHRDKEWWSSFEDYGDWTRNRIRAVRAVVKFLKKLQ